MATLTLQRFSYYGHQVRCAASVHERNKYSYRFIHGKLHLQSPLQFDDVLEKKVTL
jgi:hypothetical protein